MELSVHDQVRRMMKKEEAVLDMILTISYEMLRAGLEVGTVEHGIESMCRAYQMGRGSGTYHYLFYSCFRQRTGRNDLYTDEKGEGLPYGFCVFKRVGLSCEKIDRGANAL